MRKSLEIIAYTRARGIALIYNKSPARNVSRSIRSRAAPQCVSSRRNTVEQEKERKLTDSDEQLYRCVFVCVCVYVPSRVSLARFFNSAVVMWMYFMSSLFSRDCAPCFPLIILRFIFFFLVMRIFRVLYIKDSLFSCVFSSRRAAGYRAIFSFNYIISEKASLFYLWT